MTQAVSKKSYKEMFRQMLVLAGFLFLLVPSALKAQTDTNTQAAADTAAVPVAEEPAAEEPAEEESLISPSIEFLGVQKADNSIDLKVGLKAKVKGQFMNLYKMKVSFFQVMGEEERELGFAITDGRGKAVFNIKADSSLKADAEGKVYFKAVFAGNKAMESAEEFTEFKRARLEITPIKEDSLLSVQVKLVDIGTGEEIPVPETLVGIFVKRHFNPLKVGEGTTDENGEALVEFPLGLPGDTAGNLTLIAKLDENEVFGNLEATVVAPKWGVPVSNIIEDQPRALWSSHPPLWMLITFIVLMLVVWGHYVVIVYELFRLKKEQPKEAADATTP
ncbi:MAG TPA: hypothetical protein PKA77_03290 [Chitinophagaceae bacterium]|jgi:hypothetical protein|nr:hypothetical protein [Chitinophagaceae bacterium]HMU58008.1 hypothetical protein [Chitinophagaceae bacterium]